MRYGDCSELTRWPPCPHLLTLCHAIFHFWRINLPACPSPLYSGIIHTSALDADKKISLVFHSLEALTWFNYKSTIFFFLFFFPPPLLLSGIIIYFSSRLADTLHLAPMHSDVLTHLDGVLAWLMREDGKKKKKSSLILDLLFGVFWDHLTNLNSSAPSPLCTLLAFLLFPPLSLPSLFRCLCRLIFIFPSLMDKEHPRTSNSINCFPIYIYVHLFTSPYLCVLTLWSSAKK